jgi:hypothetical protein
VLKIALEAQVDRSGEKVHQVFLSGTRRSNLYDPTGLFGVGR